jgi:hypothetical protein
MYLAIDALATAGIDDIEFGHIDPGIVIGLFLGEYFPWIL